MANCSIALQVLPQIKESLYVCGGENETSNKDEVFRVVDTVIEYIESTGVKYTVGPFETTMEGEFTELLEIVKQAQLIAVEAGASSTLSYIKLAYNPNGVSTIEEKTDKHK